MPPAFILSQNQTLKFNCLKSLLAKSNNGSNYLLSLCWLAFKVTLFKYFEKINGNYLSFAYCQIKSHFFLIPFLIFLKRATARTAWYHRDSLYIITQTVFLCQLFFNTFLKFFEIFLIFFKLLFDKVLFSRRPRDSLTIIPLSYIHCQLFFNTFLKFFEIF